jgi:hypothetical protein
MQFLSLKTTLCFAVNSMRTIADLAGSEQILSVHLAEAPGSTLATRNGVHPSIPVTRGIDLSQPTCPKRHEIDFFSKRLILTWAPNCLHEFYK